VLTSNGNVARQLVGDETAVEKEYIVTVRALPVSTGGTTGGGGGGSVAREASPGDDDERLALLRHGLELDGRRLRPATVEVIADRIAAPRGASTGGRRRRRRRGRGGLDRGHGDGDGSEVAGGAQRGGQEEESSVRRLRFVLREGRYRQIRRMCELVGWGVVELQRVRVGRVGLDALRPGCWRFLQPGEGF
jgi:23S rRNA pseudouridine2604 synthase